MPNVMFKLQGGPWDGQTIDSAAPCEVTAGFAKVLYSMTRGAAVGQQLQLASPADTQRREENAESNDAFPNLRPHIYAITERRQSNDQVIATAVHTP